jgi:CAAX prenyl protease-like protein
MQILPPGALPYVAPYAVFLGLVEAESRFPAAAFALFPLRVLAPAALVAFFWRRGDFPELRGYRPSLATLFDVAAGLAIAALWLGPYLLVPSLPRGDPFDPALLGEGNRSLALLLRLIGFAAVTPFVEELFVRSFLLRIAETLDGGDFRKLPVGRFALRGFVVTVLWFTATHALWEWWVALPTGIALNLWLYRRRHLLACVIAHAAANAAIWALVVLGPGRLWEFL